jgi:hypothetical protein
VTLRLPHAPDSITECNCSLCRKTGFRGVYFREGEVEVQGALTPYVRADIEQPCLTQWRCSVCGVATHWTLLERWPHADSPRPERMGVNARLLDPEFAATLPVRQVDGASW